jgi:hypothetical protein
MSDTSPKYPRTKHLHFSPGGTNDDKMISSLEFESWFKDGAIITEKLDGSNVCITSESVFARSHSGPPGHPSFKPLIERHKTLTIPDGLSIFGEWCYAVHSIKYLCLKDHLNIFGIRDDKTGLWYSWSEVEYICNSLGLVTAPVILQVCAHNIIDLQALIESFARLSSVYGPTREGLVIRSAVNEVKMDVDGFLTNIAKWVRKDHVQTDDHWTTQKIIKQNAQWI